MAGSSVLVVLHGNMLRALIKHLEAIGDDAVAGLNVPGGIPLRYELDAGMRPLTGNGRYLGPLTGAQPADAARNRERQR